MTLLWGHSSFFTEKDLQEKRLLGEMNLFPLTD